ncbi:MAG TPA: cation-binding protein [Bacteroidetes bacterium]|nr:cation-binding protein [Bacteroidota bacterium]
MPGPLYEFFTSDHARLDRLIKQAVKGPHEIDLTLYSQFRAGLLKHIGMEEKMLLPMAKRSAGGARRAFIDRIRLDHSAIAALLVPTPTPMIIAALRAILSTHNALEEAVGGLYEECEHRFHAIAQDLLEELRAFPEIRTAPIIEVSMVIDATRRAVARAGYNLDDFVTDTFEVEDITYEIK